MQVLKYEPYHYSDLAAFLIERGLQNRVTIGHYLFWHLEVHTSLSYFAFLRRVACRVV
jgi:hypothetical protein